MAVAVAVVAVELAVIACDSPSLQWTPRCFPLRFQVVVGGVLVFIVGILIGSA